MKHALVLTLALGACSTKPRPMPEYPCCVGGNMASCHAEPGMEKPFVTCPDGSCADDTASCPAPEPAAAPEAEVDCDELSDDVAQALADDDTCSSDADCVRIELPCVAPCGMAAAKAAVASRDNELDTFRSQCDRSCGKVKCAAWSENTPACSNGKCVIPH